MPELRLAVLGPPRLQVDGAAVEVDTRKAIALLAYLAVTGERHGREALAGLLWPEYDEAHARGALRRTLSALNKGLRGGWLATDRTSIALDRADLWFDLERFQALLEECGAHGHQPAETCPACLAPLREAAALHRGDFLAGFALRDADGFEDWQRLQAESLRRELAGVLERLVSVQATAGRWQDAIADAHRWLALDPLHEPAHRQLMRLYAWSGQRGAALRQYRACVRVLDRELGVAPLEETTALYQTIKQGDTEHERPAPPPAAVVSLSRPPLVGRSPEWSTLLEVYEAARHDGRLVVLEGEAGIGKTRLAEEFVAHAVAAGATTIGGRCYDGESGLAYGPLVEGLRAAVAGQADSAWLQGVPAPWLAEASRLLPELVDLRPGVAPAPPLDSPGAQGRFLAGLSQVLLAALHGPAPGVLMLDDLHWADEASLDVLTYLVRRLAGQPVCILVTWRSEQVQGGHRLRRLTAEAQRAGGATVLRLARLSRPEVAELVLAVAPARAGQAAWLYEETEGLPFFLTEYLAITPEGAPGTPPPGGVRELLQAKLGPVTEAGRQLLAAAAVIGRSFDFDTVRGASGRSEEETVAALEELTERGLVREVREAGEPPVLAYDFGHERMRALVYEQISLARRRLLHRRVAEALAGRAHGRPSAASIARHFQLAGQETAAATSFKAAGDQARGLYANHEALAHYQSALALGHPDAAGLHEAIGDLETLAGAYDDAIASYEAAAASCPPADLPRLEHKLGGVHDRRGDWQAAASHLEAALAASQDDARNARLYADWSLTAHRRGDQRQAVELADRALALAEAAEDTKALAQAHNILGMLAGHLGDHVGARRHLERSLALAERLADPSSRVAALNNLALAHRAAGELERALALAETALAVCTSLGDRHRQAALHNNLADLLQTVGRREAAMGHLKQAVTIFTEVGAPARLQPEIWKLVEW
ncbi:MAG TPA: AAA family ATPase [Actinomycetota bacterium]|nr:AAA family ATPase [Actinomycetota bacterium]